MSHSYERLAAHSIASSTLVYAFAIAVSAARSVLERAEHCRRDAWLASAVDLGDLERRMRSFEADD
jgi:hypothetical protein